MPSTVPRVQGENLARAYERSLQNDRPLERKATGVYYTPAPIIEAVVRHTLKPLLASKSKNQPANLTILDPACGCGTFLLGAYHYLLEHCPNSFAERKRILANCIHGVELDPQAVALTRQALSLELRPREKAPGDRLPLQNNILHGNALVGSDLHPSITPPFDWSTRFPAIMKKGRFSAVVGNPPWGQKRIEVTPALKCYLRDRYVSSVGIFDLFRPFVELAIQLLAPGGRFGMVLPDIVLLKDYAQTRRYLLDHLALERIDCWGSAFVGAVIDVVSIIGTKRAAPAGQSVLVTLDAELPDQTHRIPQADFAANPRSVFNLHLTPAKRKALDRLAECPCLGDFFEIHEGVHSGNMRAELFIREAVDESCRPLLFGRDEIAPYRLKWAGRYVHRAKVPAQGNATQYANLGRPQWHERDKILVRRTGDHVLAAVDRRQRWVSNNFFLVFPRCESLLDLDGLCALLNSRFMTWYFRTIEPRQGRVFAELKIKHLKVFPLPLFHAVGCRKLNRLGKRRIADDSLEGPIDTLVSELFGLDVSLVE